MRSFNKVEKNKNEIIIIIIIIIIIRFEIPNLKPSPNLT